MKTTDNEFIPENHFDVLLRHALLDKEKMFNEKTLEAMAQHIFSPANAETIPVADNNSIVEKLVNDFKQRGNNFRLNIFLVSLFTVATIVSVIFFTSRDRKIAVQKNFIPVVEKQNPVLQVTPVVQQEQQQQLVENPLPRTNPVMIALLDSAKKEDSISPTIGNLNNGSSPSIATTFHIPEDKTLHYEDIPTLTEEEKKQTEKDKLKIMKDVVKKKIYSTLPMGVTSVDGKLVTVNGFSIKNAETTNFEYNTFLNDLLVQGRFDDYLLAKPVDGGWKAVGIPEFENVYAYQTSYNDFPAVNMTRKGAELYCNWLTASMKEAITNKDVKWSGTKMPVFRLPCNVEWIYAARACDTTIQTPWEKYAGKNTLQNKIGCYLCDFNYSASIGKLAPEGPPMNKNNSKGCVAAKMSTRAIVTTAARAIDTLLTAPVYSYNPNDNGLYCTVGNVSEMVWTWDLSNPTVKGVARSMGGSWFSDFENTKIEAPEQYVGVTDARAYIGFRAVMVLQ